MTVELFEGPTPAADLKDFLNQLVMELNEAVATGGDVGDELVTATGTTITHSLNNWMGIVNATGIATLSIKDFGATGNGVTDDSVAVQAAMQYASDNQVEIYVPAGEYLLNSKVAVNISVGVPENFFTIRGAGSNIAIFVVNNSSGGLEFTVTNRQIRAKITGLRFHAHIAGSGTALKVSYPTGGNQHFRSVIIDDVVAVTDDNVSHYFNTGISVEGVLRPFINNCMISGLYTGTHTDDDSDSQFYMDVGVNVSGCYGAELHNSTIWACKTAFKWVSAANPGPEGWRIINCALTNCWIGADIQTPGGEPGGYFLNSHCNFTHYGLNIDGNKVLVIANSSFYNEDSNDLSSVDPIDIWVQGPFDSSITITGNIFYFLGNSARKHIVIDSPPIVGKPFTIVDNQFSAPVTPGSEFVNNGGALVQWENNGGFRGMTFPTAAQYGFVLANGTALKNASAIDTDAITATDANIRLLAQWVKGLANAVAAQNITSPFVSGNFILNPLALGAEVGVPGNPGTYWQQAGPGWTLGIVAVGTDADLGINYVDARWSGNSSNVNCAMNFNESFQNIVALTGQTWTIEMWLALLATGTGLTNVSQIRLNSMSLTSGGVFVQHNYGSNFKASLTSVMQRFTSTLAIGGGGTVGQVYPQLAITPTASTNIDITLRVGWPQLYR